MKRLLGCVRIKDRGRGRSRGQLEAWSGPWSSRWRSYHLLETGGRSGLLRIIFAHKHHQDCTALLLGPETPGAGRAPVLRLMLQAFRFL